MSQGGVADCGVQSFVKPFQDELQEAISDYATSKETDEYSDDFESEEDGLLNGIRKELTESNLGCTSTEKSVAVESPLLNDDASQNADLENEAADDLNLSFHVEKVQQITVLEGGNIQNGEAECLEGQNEDNDMKNNEEHSPVKEVLHDTCESDDLPINEVHKKRNKEENQPEAKPWVYKKIKASASDRDQKTVSSSDLKLEDNGRKSPSVIKQMRTRVYEEAKELEQPAADSSDEMMKISEGQIKTDTMQELSVNDQSEHEEAKNTSKNSVKKLSETKERVPQNPKASLSDRSTSCVHLKKKGKAFPSTSPVASQYLASLKVLEDKCMQKKSTEFVKVDNLRAAVYQNWLEKKKLLLLELKRAEKEKAEILRNNIEKKALKREESIACYEAWKKKKDKEAKKLSEKKKLEELEEKKPAEQNKEKTEAAQAAFEKWKERKVEYLREQNRKEKQSERTRKKMEEEQVAEKRRVSASAVEKWNEKKEEYIKKKKVEKFLERRKQEMQQAEKEEKSEKAMEEYERWLENKMRREQLEKSQKKLQAIRGNEETAVLEACAQKNLKKELQEQNSSALMMQL